MKLNFSLAILRSLAKGSPSLVKSRWYQRHLPNMFTFLRLLSVPGIFLLISAQSYLWAFVIFAFAGISDWADGYLARKWQVESTFGRFFDPIADKALMVVTFILLATRNALPLWLVIVVAARDLLILSAGFYAFLSHLKIKFQPILISKLNTFIQILLVGTTLIFYSDFTTTVIHQHYFWAFQGIYLIYYILIIGCTITTLWSWWEYGVYFMSEIQRQKQNGRDS